MRPTHLFAALAPLLASPAMAQDIAVAKDMQFGKAAYYLTNIGAGVGTIGGVLLLMGLAHGTNRAGSLENPEQVVWGCIFGLVGLAVYYVGPVMNGEEPHLTMPSSDTVIALLSLAAITVYVASRMAEGEKRKKGSRKRRYHTS